LFSQAVAPRRHLALHRRGRLGLCNFKWAQAEAELVGMHL